LIRNGEKCKCKWISHIRSGYHLLWKWKWHFDLKLQESKCKWISDFQNSHQRPFWKINKLRFTNTFYQLMYKLHCESIYAFWSEMKRNLNANEFRTSGGRLLKKMKVAFRSEMARNANVNVVAVILTKNGSCILIWNGKKCKCKWISDIQSAVILTKHGSCIFLWSVEKCKRKSISDIKNGH